MTKYTEEFKLGIVKRYLDGDKGLAEVCATYGIPYSRFRDWVSVYRVHGTEGLKKKFSHYSAECKLSILKHMWNNKLSYCETAALFNIRSRGCLREWEKRYQSNGIEALMPHKKGRPRTMSDPGPQPPPSKDEDKRTRDELLAELKYLRMENEYLKKLEALVQAKKAPTKRR